MKKIFRSYLLHFIIIIGSIISVGFESIQAQSSCQLVAPESCYKVASNQYETWNGTNTSNVESHCSVRTDNKINLPANVCAYMKQKEPNTFSGNCENTDVDTLQTPIRKWVLANNTIWQNYPSWQLTKSEYHNYYTGNQNPVDKTWTFNQAPPSISLSYWDKASHRLNCQKNNGNNITMLDDGKYGYCTRMFFQLYLNQDCFVPYQLPSTNYYIWGRSSTDFGLIGLTPSQVPGINIASDEPDQIEMCVNGEITKGLMFFDRDKKGKAAVNQPHTNNLTTRACEILFPETNTPLNSGLCVIDEIKKKTATLSDKNVSEYTEDVIGHQKFKKDLNALLTKNCTYGELVIGRADDGYDLLLEKSTNADTDQNKITTFPDGSSINNYGFAPNGTIAFCHQDPTTKKYKRHQATLFIEPSGDGKISFDKGAGKYICDQMNLDASPCTLKAMHNYLANKVYKDVLPPITTHPSSTSSDPLRRNIADYSIALSELPENKDSVTPWAEVKFKPNNVFKEELSQYLTANCRSNLDEKNKDKGPVQYTVNACKTNGETEEPWSFWYYPNDRLLSKDLCVKLDNSFKNISNVIADIKTSPLAQDPNYAQQVEELRVPVPPVDFLLPNGSCRLEDFQNLVADSADYYFYRGKQLDSLKEMYQILHPSQTTGSVDQSRFFALEWFSANAFAQTNPNRITTQNHTVVNGQIDPETIAVINNITKSSCPGTCISQDSTEPKSLPPFSDFTFPSPCATNNSFSDCLNARKEAGKTCGNDCAPGYIKNHQGVCVSEDFFGWQKDHLRPKYQVGANWDDYEYKGDARDITYWGQRFGAKAINFLAITTVLFAMIAVLKMVLSGGESSQRENLKKVAQWSAIALIVAIFAYVIVKTVISMTYWG